MPLELHLYDFDGTLFKAPDRPPWWGKTTWIMDSASLGPPCVPLKPGNDWWIGKAVSDAKRSIANPDVWAILCTGRAKGSSHRYRVPELLKQKGLNFDEVYLNPGSDTKSYKIKVILKLVQRHGIEVVHIWENHLSNMAAFCQAIEARGLTCVQHPITVPAKEPVCSEQEMDDLVDEGWAKRRVAEAWLTGSVADRQALRIVQRKNDAEFKAELLDRKQDPDAWLEKWRERYESGWRGLKLARNRNACIIAAGSWDGHQCLFKNRDRNYKPEVTIVHEIRGGVEVLYLKDEVTGWCEGMNEHGIGIINAALFVDADEKSGKAGKGKSDDPATKNTLRDGQRILKGLENKTLEGALKAVQTYKGGLRGHTFIADPDTIHSLEATWRGHDYNVRKLPVGRKHVRTNHGQYHQDAGYTADDGDNYLSSLARRDQAMKVLRSIETPKEIAPAIYGKRKGEPTDPLNMVKLTDGMRTSTQMVLDLTDRTVYLYLLPKEVDYSGYKRDLPKGYESKLKLKLFEYTDITGDGVFDTVRRKKGSDHQAAAKGPTDLPDGWYVQAGWRGGSRYFSLYSDTGREVGYIRAYHDRACGGAWVVVQSWAPNGWGPMLYDLMLEHAGHDGAMPDRSQVSPDAAKLWTFYLRSRRGDVEYHPVWDDPKIRDPAGCGVHSDDPDSSTEALDFRFVKKRETATPALKAQGVWKEAATASRVADRYLSQGAEYLSAVLSPMDRVRLLKDFPPVHEDIRADHMTVWYDPPDHIREKLSPLVGKKVRVKVVGYAEDERGQAVLVDTRLPVKSRQPHITISVSPGTKAVYSNGMKYERVKGPTLDAVLKFES